MLLLSTPERLRYVRLLVPKDMRDKTLKLLQRLGVMHVEVLGELSDEDRRSLSERVESVRAFSNLITAIENYYSVTIVSIKREVSVENLDELLSDAFNRLNAMHQEIENLVSNKRRIVDEINDCLKRLRVLETLKDKVEGGVKVSELSFRGEMLFSLVAVGKAGDLEIFTSSLPEDLVITRGLAGDEFVVLVMGATGALSRVQESINRVKAEVVEFPPLDLSLLDYLSGLQRRVDELRSLLNKTEKELSDLLSSNAELLALAKVLNEVVESRLSALLNAASGEYLLAMEGWVPEGSLGLLESRLSSEIGTYLVISVPTNKKPPSKLRNLKFFKPFELVTRFYGVPSPGEWDPTPILTYSFLVFFGLMMADVVYGLLLLLIVKYVLDRSGFIDNPYSPGYISLKKMLVVLATSATVFGVLSNTFAGYSIAFRDGVIHFVVASDVKSSALTVPSFINLTDPMLFLTLALIIGLVHINIGHALSLAVGVKGRDSGRILSEAGLLIAEAFSIPYILHEFLRYDLIPLSVEWYDYMLYASLAGVLVMVIGTVKLMGGVGLFMWIFNITGILGDVLSYSRIAGLGIATYVMAANFNKLSLGIFEHFSSLAPLVGPLIGVLLMLVVAIFMNAFNLIFGSIGGFVHSMRLCFVEFLLKWYDGNGSEFMPLTLKIERYVPIGRVK
ncbi:MAG: V-type ATPase 116kDa subunit family protein [Zestosphaera sp.]